MSAKRIYIFGNNSLSELLYYYLSEDGIKVEGFCLNKQYLGDNHLSKTCFAFEDLIERYGAENIALYLTIAYKNMNHDRQKVFQMLDKCGVEIRNYIHPKAVMASNVKIGRGNIFLEQCVIQPYVKIGDSNVFWNNSTISHHSEIGNYNFFAAGVTIAGHTRIHNCTFWGCNSTSSNLIEIDDDVLVGAGAYVFKSLTKGQVIVPQRGVVLDRNSSEIILNLK